MNLDLLLDPLTAFVLVLLTGLFPWVGCWEYRRLSRWSTEGRADARLRHYTWIAVWEWITVALLLGWWFATGRSAEPLGLVLNPSGWQWAAIAAGLALTAALVVQLIVSLRDRSSLAKLRDQLGDLEKMIPRTARERSAFDRLSLTAGVCEEVMYRGVFLALLAPALGLWPAVFISSAVFGLGHIYQGRAGFFKTSAIGLVLALLTVFSGSLFTAILLHAVTDVTSGRITGAALSADKQSEPGLLRHTQPSSADG